MTPEEISDYRDIVKITFGKNGNEKVFFVHPPILKERSVFFQKALEGDWREAKDCAIDLPEDEPTVFSVYLRYLYTGNMSIDSDQTNIRAAARYERWMAINLYTLADKFQDVRSKNAATKALVKAVREVRGEKNWVLPELDNIKAIYGRTMFGSALRKLLVDLFAYYASREHLNDYDGFPKEFLFDLSSALLDLRPAMRKAGPRSSMEAYLTADFSQALFENFRLNFMNVELEPSKRKI
ncbi:hypothetical protein N0V90_010163 [Kalmusia sp. IMI 367209]|nr:hypothetical protein N0V90_010163 [Kalmusia sp. IMI 367209]